MTTINEWLDEQDGAASAHLNTRRFAGPNCLECRAAQRTLATNALLRAALKWDCHAWLCSPLRPDPCTCGYDEKAKAQKALEELLAE